MAQRTRLGEAAANAAADAVGTLLSGGLLRIYGGKQPSSARVRATNQLLLATLRFAVSAFGPATAGVIEARPIEPDEHAAGGGTATWFRALAPNGEAVFDGSIGLDGRDEANLLLQRTTVIYPDAIVRVKRLTYTQPMQ